MGSRRENWLWAAVAATVSLSSAQALAAMPGSGGTWTINAGETETVAQSDMSSYNALAKVVVNGTLVFGSDVTTAPAVVLEGSGECVKSGSADWTLSTACPNYKGQWTFKGGVVDGTVPTAFGDTGSDNDDDSAVYVESGATLRLSTSHSSGYFFLYKRFHIAGTGTSGQGAILVDVSDNKNGYIGPVYLDGDATINQPSGKSVKFMYGNIFLQSRKLTLSGGTGINIDDRAGFSGPGEIVLGSGVKIVFTKITNGFALSDPRITITTQGDNEIDFMENSANCPWPAQYADIEVGGTLKLVHSHSTIANTPVGRPSDLGVVWSGNISLPAATDMLLVKCDQTAKHCLFSVVGNISGLGKVQSFESTSDGYARVAYEGTNTFTGGMTSTPANFGAVILGNSNAVPDYAAYSMTGNGRTTLRVDGDGSRWCTNSIARFVESATLSGNTLALDASCAQGGEIALDASFWSGVKGGSQPCLVADGGTVGLTGPLSDKYYHFGAVDGALKLTGAKTIFIGESYAYSGLTGLAAGTLLIDGASNVHRGADGSDYGRLLMPGCPGFVGTNKMADDSVGRYVVRNSTVVNDMIAANPNDESKYYVMLGTSYSGKSYPGTMEVGAGADILDKVVLGKVAANIGAIYQTGGLLKNVGNNDGNGAKLMAAAGHAYQELSGGTYEQKGSFLNANATGSSYVLVQTGGVYRISDHPVSAGKANVLATGCGESCFFIGGGTFTTSENMAFLTGTVGTGSTVFTIDGAGTVVHADGYFAYGAKNMSGAFSLNLNGGLLDVNRFCRYQSQTTCTGCLNANGGTLRCRNLAGGSCLDGSVRIVVYPGGFVFHDNDEGTTIPFLSRIESAFGLGVSQIPVPDALAEKTLVCPPVVTIAETGDGGEGFGASAIALFDRATGKVTGVRVTCPGSGYTEATATFRMAGTTWTSTCTLAPNASTGGFTKKGNGAVVFGSGIVCNYGGPTVVESGTLETVDGFPSGTDLVLNGGNAVVRNGGICSFKSIGGTSGTLTTYESSYSVETLQPGTTSSVSLGGKSLSVTGTTTFDLAEVIAGQTTTYAADIAFGGSSAITVENVGLLDETDLTSITLLGVSAGNSISGLPEWTNPPASGKWRLKVSGKTVKLVKQRGFTVIFR